MRREIPRTPRLAHSICSTSSAGSTPSSIVSDSEIRIMMESDLVLSGFDDSDETHLQEDEDLFGPITSTNKSLQSASSSSSEGNTAVFSGFPLPPFRLSGTSNIPSLEIHSASSISPSPKRSTRKGNLSPNRSSSSRYPFIHGLHPSSLNTRPSWTSSPSPSRASSPPYSATSSTSSQNDLIMPITPLKQRSGMQLEPAPMGRRVVAKTPSNLRTVPPKSSRALQAAMEMGAGMKDDKTSRVGDDFERGIDSDSQRRRLPNRNPLPAGWMMI